MDVIPGAALSEYVTDTGANVFAVGEGSPEETF
jgi:hypothetical protein